ncbi:MAG: patatin-like phospholipase family protein [Gammaproteobacteria bacterium]|nr:patatin-like phospholipase family protein [Gammaproteobacteria bacterium]
MEHETGKTGIVLSSGGGRGVFAHTGFLLALQQLKIPISACAGCSAGAIVGGILASGKDLNQWAEVISQIDSRRFWNPDSLWRLAWNFTLRRGRGYTGLSEHHSAINFLNQQLGAKTFEECTIPFSTLAVSLSNGRKKTFSSGDLASTMMASAAIPLLYQPVAIGDDLFCDGAVIDLAPTEMICCRHQLDTLIVHHVSQRLFKHSIRNYFKTRNWALVEILYRLLYRHHPWYLTDEPIATHQCPCQCGANIIVLEPSLPELHWPLIEGGQKIVNSAKQQTTTLLQQTRFAHPPPAS